MFARLMAGNIAVEACSPLTFFRCHGERQIRGINFIVAGIAARDASVV